MIDFPNTPAVGDLYYAPSNGITYRWDGTLWLAGPNVGSGYGPSGDFCATQTAGLPTGTANTYVTLNPNSIISGNAGNWYSSSTGRYTPPPGRYCLYGSFACWYAAGAMSFTIHLRKNGTEIGTYNYVYSAAANYRVTPTIEVVVDANGTDWFDLQGQCVGAAGNFETATFLAYPIAGAKGPPGDKGPVGDPLLLSSATVSTPVTTVDVTWPNGTTAVDIPFSLTSAGADMSFSANLTRDGTILNAANYDMLFLYQAHSPATPQGSWGASAAAWGMGAAIRQAGTFFLRTIRAGLVEGHLNYFSSAVSTLYNYGDTAVRCQPAGAAPNGLRITTGATMQAVAGQNYVHVWQR